MTTPEEFAAKTGAMKGFHPQFPDHWMIFWQEDVCEHNEFDTAFPALALKDAQSLWAVMEENFLTKYDYFLRVWAEWGSSGIWIIPYPGSRRAGTMMLYENLPLDPELLQRFSSWQEAYDDSDPSAPHLFDWDAHEVTAQQLAEHLKACVGPRVYVERCELIEISADGGTHDCRIELGLI